MPFYRCNVGDKSKTPDKLKLIYEVTTMLQRQVELEAEYESVVVVISAAANQDSSNHVDNITVSSNGEIINLYNKKYNDGTRAVLKNLCYLVKKKSDPIKLTFSGAQVWSIFNVLLLV